MSLASMMPSPYEVLGVDPGVDDESLERTYRRRLIESHPDHGGSMAELSAVRAAYDELVNGVDVSAETLFERWNRPWRWRTEPDEARSVSTVEFLDYEVLADHGWTLEDADLFEKAADAGLDAPDYGQFHVQPSETLLEAAERGGLVWPYACRGGACANCAVALLGGDIEMPVNHILPTELMDRDYRLSCNATPASDELRVVYNVKHRPDLDEFRLPPDRFNLAHGAD